jgi:hypothetical protein
MSPHDATEEDVQSLGATAKRPHPGTIMALCADGSVRGVSPKSKPETLRALISIAGNDDAIAREGN